MTPFSTPQFDELSQELAELEDWDERYQYLVDLGRQLPRIDPALQSQENRVQGCMSTVWMSARFSSDPQRRMELIADSDSLIVKGLIVLLMSLYDQRPAAEVLDVDAEAAFRQLGLEQHLSPNRRNGLYAMVKRIRQLAAENS
jgi:cysteine desulfuration protein SufE